MEKDYKTDKKEQMRRIVKGEVEIHYVIWATSRGGTYFSIEVPEDKLDKADALLSKKAKELDAI